MKAAASASARTLWKGAIAFGLVHIPIALHPATSEHGLNFDWLDKRSMDPVGYRRINKKTGKEIDKEDIVKGIEYEDGQYVVLSPDEIATAYPKTTQTIEIEAFVPASAIPFIYLDRPYYVTPINKGAKVYALLREILHKQGKAGIARVVIQTRQHLAALVPSGPLLVLNLLRWPEQVRPIEGLVVPEQGAKAAGLSEKELKMGEQLVTDMSTGWEPDGYRDTFTERILELVEKKVKAGKLQPVSAVEPVESSGPSARIYDLTELLQQSLNKGKREIRRPRLAAADTRHKAAARPPRKPPVKRRAA